MNSEFDQIGRKEEEEKQEREELHERQEQHKRQEQQERERQEHEKEENGEPLQHKQDRSPTLSLKSKSRSTSLTSLSK